jgi:hypothetical protein
MKLFQILIFGAALIFQAQLSIAAETPDEIQRRIDAIENIQSALDEDPDEAARILGSSPIDNLDLESLEALGDKAAQFGQQKMFERQQDERDARERLQTYRDLQNARR